MHICVGCVRACVGVSNPLIILENEKNQKIWFLEPLIKVGILVEWRSYARALCSHSTPRTVIYDVQVHKSLHNGPLRSQNASLLISILHH